jgi:hypothetical protein
MYLIKADQIQETAQTEAVAIALAKEYATIWPGSVQIYKLHKVVSSEMKITVTDPGVLK